MLSTRKSHMFCNIGWLGTCSTDNKYLGFSVEWKVQKAERSFLESCK